MWKLELLHHKSGNSQKVGERPRVDPSLTPSKGACRQHPDFGLLVSKTVRWYISDVLRQPVCGILLGSPWEPNAEISAGIGDLTLFIYLTLLWCQKTGDSGMVGKCQEERRGAEVSVWFPGFQEVQTMPAALGQIRSRNTQYRRRENIQSIGCSLKTPSYMSGGQISERPPLPNGVS